MMEEWKKELNFSGVKSLLNNIKYTLQVVEKEYSKQRSETLRMKNIESKKQNIKDKNALGKKRI